MTRLKDYLTGELPEITKKLLDISAQGNLTTSTNVAEELAERLAARSTPRRKNPTRPRGYIENYRPQRATRELLHDVQNVLEEYRPHWPLTCRQVFYRLVGTGHHPKAESFYRKLCHHMANARRGRLIPFDAIRDDGVAIVRMEHFDDEDDFRRHVRQLGERYERNKLAGQNLHVECWCEAAGMIFQLAEVAHEYSVQVYSSSGFDSLTAKKELANRICEIGKPALILHLGDYDPSGESIFHSAAEDVAAFVDADKPWNTVRVQFKRVALTREQVAHYRLPTAPPKATDTRSRSWKGETCQLEALPPDTIAVILRAEIEAAIDRDQLEQDFRQERLDRAKIALALPAPGGAA